MMKKILSVWMGAMLLAALAGCSQSGQEAAVQNETDLSPQATEETQATVAEEPSPDASEPQAEQLFDSLEIEVNQGSLYLRTGDSFSYVQEDGDKADYEITGGTLYIDQRRDHKTILTLPEGVVYTSLYLTVGEGHAYVESALSLQTMELNVTRGEATLSAVSVSDSSVIEVSTGSALLSGDLGNSVTARCQEGHISMEVSAGQDDYNFEINLTTGNIHLGSEDYHGLSFSKSIDNGAQRSMALSCSRGDLSVEFNVSHSD